MGTTWNTYGKSLTAVLVAGLTAAASALTDGHLTRPEDIQIAVATVTAAGVWLAPDLPTYPGVKTGLAAILTALNWMITWLAPGPITAAEWVNLGLAFLGAIAIGVAPSVSDSEPAAPMPPPT